MFDREKENRWMRKDEINWKKAKISNVKGSYCL